MTIRIISVGKKHDSTLISAIAEYEKRLKTFARLEWQLVQPSQLPDTRLVIDDESQQIMRHIAPKSFVILLDETGKIFDNQQFATVINDRLTSGGSDFTFIIGGAYGVNDGVIERADIVWSLSKLVFPHQLVRLILVEQLYRSFTLLSGHPYHHS